MTTYINSENEPVAIRKIGSGPFEGQYVLVIIDDPNPVTGERVEAPMLLDKGTREWLREQIDWIDNEV